MDTQTLTNETSKLVIAYLIYLPVSIMLTLYVAHTLFKNGKIFMLDIFHGKQDIAFSTNKLFEIGFYLLNIGFALLILRIDNRIYSYQGMIEALSVKLGWFSIYLGIMLFFNLYMFFRGRKASKKSNTIAAHFDTGTSFNIQENKK
jgi:hypothetical protein